MSAQLQELDRQIGLGTFPLSGVFTPVTHDDAQAVVTRFFEAGGRYVETAPIYPRTEVCLARILAQFPRDAYMVGTKCVLSPGPDGNPITSGRPEVIHDQCLQELQRLGLEYIDILEAHVTPTDVPLAEVTGALSALREEGLVRYIGASNASRADVAEYLKGGPLDIIQNRYSIIHRNPTEEITKACQDSDIVFNPYQVIERGQLIDISSTAGSWGPNDLRASKAEYVGDAFERIHKWVVTELSSIATAADLSMASLSIRWTLSKPQVRIPVVGATKIWQIDSNLAGGTDPLPADVLSAVDQAYERFSDQIRSLFGLSVEEFRGLA